MNQMRRSLLLGGLLDDGAELDTRSNIVNVCLDMFRDVVPNTVKRVQDGQKQQNSLLTTNLDAGTAGMLMFIELSLEQILHFMRIGIKSQPSLVIGVYNPGLMNPRSFKPVTNRFHRIL